MRSPVAQSIPFADRNGTAMKDHDLSSTCWRRARRQHVSQLLAFAFCVAGASAQHVADYTLPGATANPMGFSRRGYFDAASSVTQDGYERGNFEWGMPIFGGAMRFMNYGAGHVLVADVGAGRGHATLPGPLVAGGPLSTVHSDFGPYAAPASLEMTLPNWGQFEAAAAHQAIPASAQFPFSGWKTIGFVTEVQQASGNYVLAAGVRISGSVRLFDIYRYDTANQTLVSIAGGGVTFTNPGNGPMVLRLVVRPNQVTLTRIYDGQAPVNLTTTDVATGVPAAVQAVRSIAMRVAGVVTSVPNATIDVTKLSLQAADVPAFTGGPVGPTTAPASSGPFLTRNGTSLERDGQYQGTGTNRVDLLNFFAGFEATADYAEHVLDELVANTDQRVVRFSVFDEFNKYSRPVAGTTPSAPGINLPLWSLAGTNSDAYFAAFDALVDAATARGIALVPVLVWDPRLPIAFVEEMAMEDVGLAQVRQLYGVDPIVDPVVATARQVLEARIAAVVGRYRDNRTILFWEVGNEWDNYVEMRLLTTHHESWPILWSDAATCGQAVAFVTNLVKQGPTGDSNHLVSAGYAGAASLYKGLGDCANATTVQQALRDYHPEVIDLVSFHAYAGNTVLPVVPAPCGGWPPAPFSDWAQWSQAIHEMCRTLHPGTAVPARPLYFGETNFNDASYDGSKWQSALDDMLGLLAAKVLRPQLAFTWEWMRVPHDTFTNDEWWFNDLTSAQLSDANSRLSRFEQSWTTPAAAPRVLRAGFGTSYATSAVTSVPVTVEVQDRQGDVNAVEVIDPAGALVVGLTFQAATGRWTGNVPAPAPSQWLSYRVVAHDAAGHTSRPWPHLAVGNPTAAGVAPTQPAAPNGGVPSNPGFPFITLAGYEGFDRIGIDGGPVRLTAEVVLTSGTPAAGALVVFTRVNLGGLGPYDDWTLLPYGAVVGTAFEKHFELVPNGSLLGLAVPIEMQAVHWTGSAFLFSDVWPRTTGH